MKGNTMEHKISHKKELPGECFGKRQKDSGSGQQFVYHLRKGLTGLILISLMFSSCVGKKVLLQEQDKSAQCMENLVECQASVDEMIERNRELANMILSLEMELANCQSENDLLQEQLEYFKSTNTNLLDRLADLSVVSKAGAESIKKSLEALNEQNIYIKDLTSSIRQKDSINLALVMNLKRSLADFDDRDISIEVKKGVVYISISDRMMFKSGSAEIGTQADLVLGKIASILNDHQQLEIMVEGHTDSVPISTACMVDNWDLSVKRATSVVRRLQTTHGIAPTRMTAGGRSEYIPKSTNETAEGRATNRRTEIIILPELDQFFELLEPPETSYDQNIHNQSDS
jgi:chemotaxis protein MotB